MRGRLFPTRFNKVLEAHNVALDVGTRVFQRVTDTGLRREMDHAIKIVLGKERVNDLTISQVTLHKRKPGVLEQRVQSILLEIDVVVVIEAINTYDITVRIEQCLRNIGTNKACGAGYQIPVHVERPVFMRALNHERTGTKW